MRKLGLTVAMMAIVVGMANAAPPKPEPKKGQAMLLLEVKSVTSTLGAKGKPEAYKVTMTIKEVITAADTKLPETLQVGKEVVREMKPTDSWKWVGGGGTVRPTNMKNGDQNWAMVAVDEKGQFEVQMIFARELTKAWKPK